MPFRSRKSSSAKVSCPRPGAAREALKPTVRGGGCRPWTAGGFSLIELIVAFAVIGISFGVVFQGIGSGLRLRGRVSEQVRLDLVAEGLLGGLVTRHAPEQPEEGEANGVRWRIEAVGPAASPGATTVPGTPGVAAGEGLVLVRLTLVAPSGLTWELHTLLPEEPAQR